MAGKKTLMSSVCLALLLCFFAPHLTSTSSRQLCNGVTECSSPAGSSCQVPPFGIAGPALWNRTYGGPNTDVGRAVVNLTGAGFAIVGWTNSSGAGNADMWLVRTDSTGAALWNRTFGGSEADYGYSLVSLAGGGFLLAGETYSFGATYGDIWLVRTDASGNLLWNHTYGTIDGDYGSSVVVCSGGGFAIGGYTASQGGGNLWLIRTNYLGIPIWNRTYGGPQVEKAYYGHTLIQCHDGGFALTGYTVSYGLGGGGDYYVVRTNSTGHMLWNSTFGGTDIDRTHSVAECASGGFVLCGFSRSFVAGEAGLWLVRIDANGHHLWNRTYWGLNGDGGYQIQEMPDGDLVLAGATRNYGAGNNDLWLVRTDSAGVPEWNHTFGGPLDDYGYSLAVLGDSDFVIAGSTYNYGAGNEDLWLVRAQIQPPTTTTTTITPPPIPGFPTFALALGLLAALTFGLVTRHRRKRGPP